MAEELLEKSGPFHGGERAMQVRAGVEDRVAQVGRRFIRRAMPDQHREFFELLPFILLGELDDEGRPWATLREGVPGFVFSPDKKSLRIDAPGRFDDVIGRQTAVGDKVGVLGMQLETRRRNRMNGVVAEADAHGITIAVDQSFGNCPQYIQSRAVSLETADGSPGPVEQAASVGEAARRQVEQADTFFIATRSAEMSGDGVDGVDVSHRGGKPGFVKVSQEGELLFPDFSGNKFFNTLGNIQTDPRAGLLFPDFRTGTTLSIAGRGRVIWEGPELEAFQGAERLVAIEVDRVVRAPGHLGLRAALIEPSPVLARTGRWA